MNTHSISINKWKGFEKLNATHLVFSLLNTKLAMSYVFKFEATICSATIVNHKNNMVTLSHIKLPTTRTISPSILYHLRMRTTIYINCNRIFLFGIKISRFHHSIMQVRNSVGSFYCSRFNSWHSIFSKRILSLRQKRVLAASCVNQINSTRVIMCRVSINKISARGTN